MSVVLLVPAVALAALALAAHRLERRIADEAWAVEELTRRLDVLAVAAGQLLAETGAAQRRHATLRAP